jgi:hypothetical protein
VVGSVAVALGMKLVKLFGAGVSGADGQGFLAIQMPGWPMSADDLSLIKPESAKAKAFPNQASQARFSFARLVNLIPRSVGLYLDSSDRLVWDEYRRVLTDAVIVEREPTEQEKRSLFEARKVLFELKAPGSEEFFVPWRESAKLQAYHKYESAYRTQVDVASSIDLAADGSKSQSKRAVAEARRDWEALGYKNEVEAAFETIEQITANSPRLAWADWKDAFKRSKRTDLITDASYYETYLYPDTFFDDVHAENWMKLSMDSDEVDELTVSAGQSSDVVRMAATKDVSIKNLSLEVARIQVIRPWFTPSVIRSRSWEWGNPSMQPISDGGSPPQGGMVAYATEAVFARNIDIEFAVSPVKSAGAALLAGPLKIDPSSVVGNRATSKGMQLIAFICERTPKSPNRPAPGRISVRNTGAFVARFTISYEQGGKTKVAESGDIRALATTDIPIPREATRISLKIEIMTFPWPVETWSTVATQIFDEPVKQLYNVSGVTWDPKVAGPLSPG